MAERSAPVKAGRQATDGGVVVVVVGVTVVVVGVVAADVVTTTVTTKHSSAGRDRSRCRRGVISDAVRAVNGREAVGTRGGRCERGEGRSRCPHSANLGHRVPTWVPLVHSGRARGAAREEGDDARGNTPGHIARYHGRVGDGSAEHDGARAGVRRSLLGGRHRGCRGHAEALAVALLPHRGVVATGGRRVGGVVTVGAEARRGLGVTGGQGEGRDVADGRRRADGSDRGPPAARGRRCCLLAEGEGDRSGGCDPGSVARDRAASF